jgi:hypothetical protein
MSLPRIKKSVIWWTDSGVMYHKFYIRSYNLRRVRWKWDEARCVSMTCVRFVTLGNQMYREFFTPWHFCVTKHRCSEPQMPSDKAGTVGLIQILCDYEQNRCFTSDNAIWSRLKVLALYLCFRLFSLVSHLSTFHIFTLAFSNETCDRSSDVCRVDHTWRSADRSAPACHNSFQTWVRVLPVGRYVSIERLSVGFCRQYRFMK